jgi:hypothetical protein
MPWVEPKPSEMLDAATSRQIEAPLKQYRDKVFAEIARSNFYEAATEAYHDLAISTAVMQIQDGQPGRPRICQAIPLPTVYLLRGTYGEVGGVFRVFKARCSELPVYYGDDLPAKYAAMAVSKPEREYEVTECVWREWDPKVQESWNIVVYIGADVIRDKTVQGIGSSPLLTGRWRTDASTAWGLGPLYTALPTIRVLDELGYLVLKNLNRVVDPSGFYDEDGFTNLEQGLVPGRWVARLPGSKQDTIKSDQNFDLTFYSQDDMRHQIKRALFQDRPEQSGDTPPTATQWMDEKARTARRLPVGRLTTWQIQVFARFAYLMTQAGELAPVELNGRAISLTITSPLAKQLQQESVVLTMRFLDVANQYFPDAAKLLIDPQKTLEMIKKVMQEENVVIRSDEEIQKLVPMLMQGAQAMGAIPGPGGAAPKAAA